MKLVFPFILVMLLLAGCGDLGQQDPTDQNSSNQLPVASHDLYLEDATGGTGLHAEGLYDPVGSCGTDGCHLTDLSGSDNAPSCLSCHEALWEGGATPSNHDTLLVGQVHHPKYLDALHFCVGCHGASLRGGTIAPTSCYQCHGVRWVINGPPADHTDSEDGYLHASDKDNPLVDCVECHGADLTGDTGAPSCYKCHGAEWLDGGDD